MRKVVLLCAAGMSTSLLVNKMRDAAKEEGYDCEINAYALATAKEHTDADVVLLGPQVRFGLNNVKKDLPGIPVEAIDMQAYGTMNGKKVIAQVKKLLSN